MPFIIIIYYRGLRERARTVPVTNAKPGLVAARNTPPEILSASFTRSRPFEDRP